MNNDFKIILEAMIDKSSLSDIQKEVAKKQLKISADIDIKDFAKDKKKLIDEFERIGKEINKILGGALDSKEATKWAKELYHQTISSAKQAAKAQDDLNKAQKNHKLAEQEKYYKRIIENNKEIYRLQEKRLTANREETREIDRQIRNLNKRNKRAYDSISQKGLGDTQWGLEVSSSERELKNRLAIKEARLQDKDNAREQALIEQQIAEYNQEQLEYAKLRDKYKTEGEKQAQKVYSNYENERLKEANGLISQQEKAYEEIWKINKKIASLDPNKDSNEIAALNQKKKIKEDIIVSTDKSLNSYRDIVSVEKTLSELAKIRDKAEADIAVTIGKQQDALREQVDKIQHSLDVGDYDVKVKSFEIALQKAGVEGTELENKLSGVKTSLDNLQKSATGDNIIPDTVIKNARLLDIEIEKISNDIKSIKLDNSLMADELRVNDTVTKLNEQLRKNSKYSGEAKSKIQSWIKELEEGDVAEARLKAINSQAKALHAEMGRLGKIGKSTWQTFKEGFRSFIEWTSASGTVMEIVQGFRYMYDAVLDIDTAITNLYKVTDETSDRYNRFLESACDNAQRLGRTVSSLVKQTANWSKLGYSLDDAEKLAQISSIYANVGEVDDATAVSDMVTAMKAFNIEASDAVTIIDKLNALGKTYCPAI